MAKRVPLVVAGQEFPTQKALRAYTIALRSRYPVGTTLAPADTTFTVCVLAQPGAVAASGTANSAVGLYVVQCYPGLGRVTSMAKGGPPASANVVLPRR